MAVVCFFLLLLWLPLIRPQHTSLEHEQPGTTTKPGHVKHGHHATLRKSAQCGTWQRNYTALHRRATEYAASLSSSSSSSSSAPPRTLIFRSPNSGITDRLVGLITGFYAAVLSDRAFFVSDWWMYQAEHTDLLQALDWAHANFTLPRQLEDRLRPPSSQYVHFNYINTEPLLSTKAEAAQARDRAVLFSSAANDSTILFESNRGNVFGMLQTHGAALGVHPPFGLYCAFHYLFKARAETEDAMRPLFPALSAEGTVKIGLQIRTGDRGYSFPTTAKVEDKPYYGNFFSCAQTIETGLRKQLPPDQRPVSLFLISDSKSLKQDAAARYPNLLADTQHTPMHVGITNNVNDLKANGPLAMVLAVADVLMLAMCDYFVVSHDSGLGKLAALLSPLALEGRVFAANDQGCRALTDAEMASSNQGAR